MTYFDPVRALAAEIRACGKPAEKPRFMPEGPLPDDLAAIATALAETDGYFRLGQWELGIGGERDVPGMLDALECDEDDLPTEPRLLILANNAGDLVTIVGFDPEDLDLGAEVYVLDQEYSEVRQIGSMRRWITKLIDDPRERERDGGDGLLSALAAKRAAAGT